MKEVPGHVGWKGKVQLKCGEGGKVLVAVGRAPFKKGAPLSERACPCCLLDRQGARAPIDFLIDRGLEHLLAGGSSTYWLLDRQGARAPIDYLIGRGLEHLLAGGSSTFGRFGDLLLFFDAAKSWWKPDPLAVIQTFRPNFFFNILTLLCTLYNQLTFLEEC